MQQQAEAYASSYGTTADAMIKQQLNYYGFADDDMDGYSTMAAKNEKLRNDYIEANFDDVFEPVYKNKKPHVVSHILIKVADINNPTEEEQKKIDAVEKALKDGKDFAEVAKEYSDDTGSKEKGGYIGYIDSDNTTYVSSFKEASLKLKEGEVSDWVKESNDSYSGWHMIKADIADKDSFKKDEKAKDDVYDAIAKANSDLSFKYVWQAAQKLDIKYANDDIKKQLLEYMGVEE